MLTTFLLLLVFIAMGMPVAFAIGVSATAFFLQHPELPFTMIVQLPISQTQNIAILAVPLFILAGNLMNEAGITSRFVKLSTILTGHMRAGLAQVSVVLSTLMGGVSGSAIADAAMEARILGPEMLKRGYSKGFTANNIAFTGLITATIPPGVGLIIYGTVGEVSIGQLFAAGLIVGLIMMVMMMATVAITARRRGYAPERDKRASLKEILASLKETVWALAFPFMLLFGIRMGVFTPAEIGAFACLYAIFIGVVVYKELTWKKILQTLESSIIDIGAIMFIIALSAIFGYGIPIDHLPDVLTGFMTGVTTSPQLVMVMIVIFLVFAGMFMDGAVVILLFTPIFLPLVRDLGVDPVHFGLIFCTTVTMGNMTPPVGLAMYAVCSILNIEISEYSREILPWVSVVVLELIILIFLPDVVLLLPRLLFGR